jgi:uncharacterized protein (DUF4415 family)
MYTYNEVQMKQRKAVTGRRKVKGLRAVAAEKKRTRGLPAELEAFYKPIKKPVTLRLDADVLAWFQRHGRGYQTRINRALRKVMMEERK